jgi:hypothetical protein
MTIRRITVSLALAFSAGCVAKESIADNPGDTEPGDAESGDTEPGDTGEGMSGAIDGDTGEVPQGPVIVDGVVDCSTIPPGGPTVAGGELNDLGFPVAHCNPRAEPSDPTNTEYSCCSVDPAAEGGALPAYEGKNITGKPPYFAGADNDLGTWGMCVRTSDIPFGSGLLETEALNCPVPCNPTWSDDDVASVCGSGRVCCQTHPLEPEDCVVDPDTGEWRPVTGDDIGREYEDGTTITDWAPGAHATHQDPSGTGCSILAGGTSGAAFLACVAELDVADQRGVCLALEFGQVCPHLQPTWVDACEQL